MPSETVAPLSGNRAWVYARRADLELCRHRQGHALAYAVRSRRLAPDNPLAHAVIELVRSRVGSILPKLDTDAIVAAMDRIEGWLTPPEAAVLARCVAATPTDGASEVIEIGSYCGRSTVVIAMTIAASGRPLKLTAVDPHVGYAFANGRDTYASLVDTLRSNRLTETVDVIRARSVDVPLDGHPISMAFIDALHDRESVRADYAHVAPHMVHGGLLVFHDYADDFPGVVDTVNELLVGGRHELVGFAGSIAALRRY